MVDKRLILAVAGSGKTRLIIEKLNTEKRFLILTYTNNNYELIKRRVLNKFGYIPKNINIIKFFDFLILFVVNHFYISNIISKAFIGKTHQKLQDLKRIYQNYD